MAVIKANKVEFEVIRQDVPGAAAKYMMVLSYEPVGYQSKEIIDIVLCNKIPYIKLAKEDSRILDVLQMSGPDGHTTSPYLPPKEVFGKGPTVQEVIDQANQDIEYDYSRGKISEEEYQKWFTGK